MNKRKVTFLDRLQDYYTTFAILACLLFIVGILFLKYKDKQAKKKRMRKLIKNISVSV
jgi:preprotein translocase subunit YajC